jgi:protein-S-isoprenylcysteine O-methyltransferase Ste14
VIVRNAIRKDVLCFALPALLVYTAGVAVSGWDLVRRHAQNVTGLALIVTGLIVLFVSAGTLGRSYSSTLVIKKGHRLVTHGIYRFVRHPIYLGAILVSMGMPVYASSLYGLLIMSALIPLFLIRIRIEERLLVDAFGEAYRAYQETTSVLIPFIY